MAKSYNGSPGGSDAATIKPKLIPDFELQARDDSGGPDYDPYTAMFGDGEFKQGAKAHLSPSGGSDDGLGNNGAGDEVESRPRTNDKGTYKPSSDSQDKIPAKSRSMARK